MWQPNGQTAGQAGQGAHASVGRLFFPPFCSAMCIRKPAQKLLDELQVPYEDEGSFVVVKVGSPALPQAHMPLRFTPKILPAVAAQ